MTAEGVIIRDFAEDDYEELIRLWEVTGLTYPEREDSLDVIRETLNKNGKLIVISNTCPDNPGKSGAAIIGSCWITNDGRRLHLHHFGVHPGYQNRGYGKKLAEASMEFIKQMKMQVKLEVHKENHAAIHIYEQHGFFAFKDYYIYMLRLFLLAALLFFSGKAINLKAQDDFWQDWDSNLVNQANTGAGLNYLSEDEKTVILLTNMARLNGPLFAETFLSKYMELADMKPNSYTRSLKRELMKTADLPVLIPEEDLFRIARGHAIKSGSSGHAGHKGFNRRYKEAMKKYNTVGENCDYGNHSPMQIVLRLLIDEGIKNLGHRKNMLDPKFNAIGVSIKPHKVYDYNCVMSFGTLGRSYRDYMD